MPESGMLAHGIEETQQPTNLGICLMLCNSVIESITLFLWYTAYVRNTEEAAL